MVVCVRNDSLVKGWPFELTFKEFIKSVFWQLVENIR